MELVKRQNLYDVETAKLTTKIPRRLYERLRTQAFKERKSMSLILAEFLEEGLDRKEKRNEGDAAINN